MQADDIERLRKRWGRRACQHPQVEEIFKRGTRTGRYGCAMCGEVFEQRPKSASVQGFELTVLAGFDKGKKLVIGSHGEFVIGRDSTCQVRLPAPSVSPRHCAMRSTGEGLFVRDLGSQAGTLVNDSPIQEETPLRPGDTLSIGPFRFELASPGTSVSTGPSMPAESAAATAVEPAASSAAQRPEPPRAAAKPRTTVKPAASSVAQRAEPSRATAKRSGTEPARSLVKVYRRFWDVAVVRLNTPRVETHNMQKVINDLMALVDEGDKKIVLNLADVEYMNVHILAQLLKLKNKLSGAGGGLWLCSMPAALETIVVSAGLTKVLDISDSEQTAVDAMADREA